MTEKALIMSITENKILAARFEKEECTSCSAGCAKRNHAFEIANPQNMKISSGSIVII